MGTLLSFALISYRGLDLLDLSGRFFIAEAQARRVLSGAANSHSGPAFQELRLKRQFLPVEPISGSSSLLTDQRIMYSAQLLTQVRVEIPIKATPG